MKRDGGGDSWTSTGCERGRERARKREQYVAEMGTGTMVGTRTGTRIASERAGERGRSAKNRTRVVDAMWETGETWVERGKNVERKGLVQAANLDNLKNNKEAGGGTRYPGLK